MSKRAVVIRIDGKTIALLVVAALAIGYLVARGGMHRPRPDHATPAAAGGSIVVLGDFETAEEIARWQPNGVLIAQVDEHVGHGAHAIKLTYRGGLEAPLFKLERWFDKERRAQNWTGYTDLVFHLYNPQESQERLILQLKDDEERRYKENIMIGPHQDLEWRVPLADVANQLNLKHISQFNLFQWTPDHASTFYLDYVHLEREATSTETAAQPAAPPTGASRTEVSTSAPSASTATPSIEEAVITPNSLWGLRFQAELAKWQGQDASTKRSVVRIPVEVVGPAVPLSVDFSLTGGVPFPMGQLRPGAPVRVVDLGGATWSSQVRPMATWEDGSVKWLLLTARVPEQAKARHLWLEYGPGLSAATPSAPQVRVEDTPERVIVTTGPMRFAVNKQRFTLFESAQIDRNRDGTFEEELASSGDLVVRHHETEFRSSLDAQTYQLIVEDSGPLRATLKASGWFRDAAGNGFCQFIVRIQAFAGLPQVRVYHTFIYTGYPANHFHQAYDGIPLPENETIQELSVELPVAVASHGAQLISADDAQAFSMPLDEPTVISQYTYNAYRLLTGRDEARAGVRHDGWMLVQGQASGVLACVRDAWQQHPKEFAVDPASGRMTVKLWPASAGALSLETGPEAYGPDAVARGSAFGLGKTHELMIGFLGAAVDPGTARALTTLWREPWLLAVEPEWLLASGAWGTLGAAKPDQFGDAESMLDGVFTWAQRQPKDFAWYGLLDYGDTRVWYRKEAYDKSYEEWGWHPEGRWGWANCEAIGNYGGFLTSFMRTLNLKYFQLGESSARHIMDVDTVHYNTVEHDPRLRSKISDEFSRVGSMHRHNAYHWGGRNEEATHTNVTGLLMYYYLTGYERAWDVAQEVGSFFLRDPVTYTKHPDIAPSRAIGNVLWGDVLLYQATWDARYLRAAERWIDVLLAGQQPDGSWLDTYNPRGKSWTGEMGKRYMAFHVLPALIAYHRLTGKPSVARAIIKGTEALIANEQYLQFFDALAYSYLLTGKRPYLDEGMRRIQELIMSQRHVDDPTMNGMVFQKATYDRVAPVLYSVPFLLDTIELPDFSTLEKALPPALVHPHPTPTSRSAPATAATIPYDVLIVPSTEKVLPELGELPSAHPNPAHVSLARNEYEAVQLVIRTSAAPLTQVTVEPSDLKQVYGPGVIPHTAITWSPVGFVKTKRPDYNVPHAGWWPDPLPGAEPFDVKPDWLQPVWLTVYAPPGTPAGEYVGTVTIRPARAQATAIQLKVTVWDFALPQTSALQTAFDVYPNRIQSAYEKFFPLWWKEWHSRLGGLDQLEQAFYDDLIRHRLAPILNIDVAGSEQASYLTRLREQGLSAFSVGEHGGTFDNNWPNDPAELSALQPIYRQYAEVLRDAGLLDSHYIYLYDEPEPGLPKVAEVARMIHEADPTLRTLVAFHEAPNVEKLAAWFKDIDIVCLRNVAFDPAQTERLRLMGKEVWLYVSGPSPPFPTLVIDYPGMAYRIIPWMCWKYGLKGLLYWCVNYWTTNPYQDPMNTKWGQNGNGSLYYPGPEGPVSSIRLEVLRDGIEDYDYLALLKHLVDRVQFTVGDTPDAKTQELLTQARQALAVDPRLVESMRGYAKDANVLFAQRDAVAKLIEALQVQVEVGR